MDPSLSSSSSSSEDVSQLSPDHDNETEISSSDIIKSNGKAPKSSSDNELEAGSELSELTAGAHYDDGFEWVDFSAPGPFNRYPWTSEEDEYITVKAKAGKDEEKMNKDAAFCLYCSKYFNADNVLKMKCKCKKFALIHKDCQRAEDCSNCKQRIKFVPVTLSKDCQPTSSSEKVDQK